MFNKSWTISTLIIFTTFTFAAFSADRNEPPGIFAQELAAFDEAGFTRKMRIPTFIIINAIAKNNEIIEQISGGYANLPFLISRLGDMCNIFAFGETGQEICDATLNYLDERFGNGEEFSASEFFIAAAPVIAQIVAAMALAANANQKIFADQLAYLPYIILTVRLATSARLGCNKLADLCRRRGQYFYSTCSAIAGLVPIFGTANLVCYSMFREICDKSLAHFFFNENQLAKEL